MPDFTPNPEWPPSLPWLIALWLAAIGAAIGSFLNVMVYRLPRGISLVHPGSRCPSCGHAIRWHDNVPVLGWLILKGRCRDCRVRISPRYPLIEALVGVVFVALAACELFAGGEMYDLTVAGRIAWHAMLVCTLLAAGLMELDRQRPPLKLFLPALLVGLAAPLVWPELRTLRLMDPLPPDLALNGISRFREGEAPAEPLHPLAGNASARQEPRPPIPRITKCYLDSHWLAALETLAGIGAGVGFGCLVWPASGLGWSKSKGRWMATMEFALVGCYLGWQMVPLGSFAMFAYFATLVRGNRWDGPTSYDNLSLPMAVASLLGIASQRRLATLHSTAELVTTFIVFGVLIAAASLVVRYTAHRRRASRLGKLSRK